MIDSATPLSDIAAAWDGNLLQDLDGLRAHLDILPEDSTAIIWSGSMAERLGDIDPRTWLRPGREAFDAACDAIRPALDEKKITLCLRPHARHVLSDTQSCMQFLLAREDQPFSIALDPAAMFEASMLGLAEDHLTRMFETLGDRCQMVLLSDVVPLEDDISIEHPMGSGVLPGAVVRSLIEANVPPGIPIVLPFGAEGSESEWFSGRS